MPARPLTLRQVKELKGQRMRARLLSVMGALTVVGMLACGYGHAAVNSELYIEGSASIKMGLSLNSITAMQEMTAEICENTEIGATKQLKDLRDGKFYWVAKLADNECWMTQNLALDLSTSVALTPEDSDVQKNWLPEYDTATEVTSGTILKNAAGTRSWNLGSYYIKDPAGTTNCGAKKNSLADCTSRFAPLTTPTSANGDERAHYLAGNYYQWNTATAATGDLTKQGEAEGSICPKGWRLSRYDGKKSFQALMKAYDIYNDAAGRNAIVDAPFYMVRAGNAFQDTNFFNFAGLYGDIWTSVVATAANGTAYDFWLTGTSLGYVAGDKYFGVAVRCVAR